MGEQALDQEILEKEFLKDEQFPKDKILWYLADTFIDKIIDKKIIICQSPTGTGKSVILPYKLLIKKNDNKFLFDRIFVSEPRRIATEGPANAVMSYNHNDLYKGPKRTIGYLHGKDKENPDADLLYITEGSLINKIKRNELEKEKSYCFILDEAHEKNKETEELLINFKYLMDEGNWNSKNIIIILSATMPVEWIPELKKYETNIISVEINSGEFKKSFTETILTENNPIKNFFGINPIFIDFNLSTTFPITEYYSLKQIENYLGTALELARRAYKNNEKVLIFVSTNSQINKIKNYIENYKSGEWIGIKQNVYYVSSSQDDWKKKDRKEKLLNSQKGIIISTSILETSVTINNLTTVIDTGKIRQPIYLSELGLETLPVSDITELNRIQRKGRVGRKKPGKIYYLYTEEYKNSFRKETFSSLSVNDITQEVLKYKKNNKLFELFKKSNICKKMPKSIKNSIEKLQSYNLLDEKENITNFGLNVLNKLEKTILELEYICLLYYSIHNNLNQFPNLLFIVTFLNYINDQNNRDIFEEIKRSSQNNIFQLIIDNQVHIWSKIKQDFISNYKQFPEIKADFKNDRKFIYDEKFISRALYSVFNKNIAKYIEEYNETTKEKIIKYELPNGLEIMREFFYKYYSSLRENISFQGEGTLISKNVLYMNSFFADNISMKYCIDVTDVIEEDKRLYLSFQMQINDRIKELKKLVNYDSIKNNSNTNEPFNNEEIAKNILKDLQTAIPDCDFIIVGGYAVKHYYPGHVTSDIDVKAYPKNNKNIYGIILEIQKFNENFEKYGIIKPNYKQDINLFKYAVKESNGIKVILEITFSDVEDKGSFKIDGDYKYRNKFYLINELLINTGPKNNSSFEVRYKKNIELQELLFKYTGSPTLSNFEKSTIILDSTILKQIDELKKYYENIFEGKVVSWIRQLENLRDQEIYNQLNPKDNTDPNESIVVQPSEGKVNLKVPLI